MQLASNAKSKGVKDGIIVDTQRYQISNFQEEKAGRSQLTVNAGLPANSYR